MEGGSHVVRIGICDSHDIALAGLKSTLSGHGLIVEATARTCAQALALADASHGMVVLVDVDLKSGEVSAGDVIERVTAAGGIAIATGVSGDPSVLFRALRWGARGYLTKDLPTRAWADAIRAAARGEALICRSMTAALIDEYRAVARATPVGELLPSDRRLTPREWQVLGAGRRGQDQPHGGGRSEHLRGDRTHARLEDPEQAGDAQPLGGGSAVPPFARCALATPG